MLGILLVILRRRLKMVKNDTTKKELLQWLTENPSWDELELATITIDGTPHQYNWYQAKQIYLGLQAGVDISIYTDPKFEFDQMREIRDGLMDGVDARLYADPKLSIDEMYHMRDRLEDGTSPEYSYY